MQETKKLIKDLVKVDLTRSQMSALESFVGDRGPAIFRNSNLLKAINRSDFDAAVLEFRKWTIDSGRQRDDLIELREKEIALFTKSH
jgi:GH24 family phage-related lysozyme (muramidase)